MREDPYSALYGLMADAAAPEGLDRPARLRLGTVLSAAPLKLDVAGTIQEADRIYIAHRLTEGHEERLALSCSGVSGRLDITACCPMGSHSGMGVHGGALACAAVAAQAEPVLRAGDAVLLLTADDERFYLIDKVVACG